MQSGQLQQRQNSEMNASNTIMQRAKKMSIDEIDKTNANRSQSIENILSSSIARAKEKIQMMEQKKNIKDFKDSILSNNSSRSMEKRETASNTSLSKDMPPLSKDQSPLQPKVYSPILPPNINQLQPQQPSSNSKPSQQQTPSFKKQPIEEIQTTRSRQPVNKLQSNSAVVNVVKTLQIKVSQLQRLNESMSREKLIMTKQLNNVTQQKKMLLQSMQQVKKKNIHLQHTVIKSTKQQLKQLQQKLEQLETQNLQLKNNIKQLQLNLKQQHQNHLSIQKNNQKRIKQKREQQKNMQKQQMIYLSKKKQLEMLQKNLNVKEKELGEKEKKLQLKWKEVFDRETDIVEREKIIQQKQHKSYDDLVRHNQTMNLANQVRKQLQQKNIELRKLFEQQRRQNQQNKVKLKLLQQQLVEQIQQRKQGQENITQLYIAKINQLQEEIQQLKDTYKTNSKSKSKLSLINKNDKIEALKDQIVDITEQYDQLVARYKKNEEKLQKEQKQAKNYRSKFWKLKEIISEISQKVSKMPNAIHSQLKLLIVKANKLESYQIQKSSLSQIYGTPSKKSRSNSAQKSISKLSKERSRSKEKSISKNKTMNLGTQLNSSRKSNHSVKSKRSQKSQRSLSKKKQVIISTANKALSNQTDQKIILLQREIQQLKNTYKKLVEIMNEKNDEQTRNDLNTLVFQLQQRSEQLTRLKKQKKNKRL